MWRKAARLCMRNGQQRWSRCARGRCSCRRGSGRGRSRQHPSNILGQHCWHSPGCSSHQSNRADCAVNNSSSSCCSSNDSPAAAALLLLQTTASSAMAPTGPVPTVATVATGAVTAPAALPTGARQSHEASTSGSMKSVPAAILSPSPTARAITMVGAQAWGHLLWFFCMPGPAALHHHCRG